MQFDRKTVVVENGSSNVFVLRSIRELLTVLSMRIGEFPSKHRCKANKRILPHMQRAK